MLKGKTFNFKRGRGRGRGKRENNHESISDLEQELEFFDL